MGLYGSYELYMGLYRGFGEGFGLEVFHMKKIYF